MPHPTLPLCFVLMPSGRRPGAGGAVIDFDAVWRDLVAPAVRDAGLEPLRADDGDAGALLQGPMLERLVLCEFAVADLTTADPNVFYELGVRHGVRPSATVPVVAAGGASGGASVPFDIASLRALPYRLGPDGAPSAAAADRAALTQRLRAARDGAADSPVFRLVDGFPDIQRLKTDVFRDRVEYARSAKDRLLAARAKGADAVRAVAAELAAAPGGLAATEAGIAVDLLLSFRAAKCWAEMIDLVPRMAAPLAATPLVQEQLGFALNRAGRSDDAERVLRDVLARRGPSSETCGLLGRVYKDRWEAATKAGDAPAGAAWLRKAVDTYLVGFESDWRDAYPGVNAVTLMELCEPPDPRGAKLVPVVAYAVARRVAAGRPDYWDHATRVELSVLGRDEAGARAALADALAAVREPWEPETTARNLRLIREARERRGDALPWAAAVERELAGRAAPPQAPPRA